MVSHSSREVLRRTGLVPEELQPKQRFCADDLLVVRMPLPIPPSPNIAVLIRDEGDPPPDRGGTHPWPDPRKQYHHHGEH